MRKQMQPHPNRPKTRATNIYQAKANENHHYGNRIQPENGVVHTSFLGGKRKCRLLFGYVTEKSISTIPNNWHKQHSHLIN